MVRRIDDLVFDDVPEKNRLWLSVGVVALDKSTSKQLGFGIMAITKASSFRLIRRRS
jgi:hypothetical protein